MDLKGHTFNPEFMESFQENQVSVKFVIILTNLEVFCVQKGQMMTFKVENWFKSAPSFPSFTFSEIILLQLNSLFKCQSEWFKKKI